MGLPLWLGRDFGHIVQKENVITMGFRNIWMLERFGFFP
jgi:hypothetical protein